MYVCSPQPGYLLVEPVDPEKFNPSSLASLDQEENHGTTGQVLAIGDPAVFENFGGHLVAPSHLSLGDVVVYMKYSEQVVRVNNQRYHLVRFDKVIGKIEEDNNAA